MSRPAGTEPMADRAETTIRRHADGLDDRDAAALDALVALLHRQLHQLAYQHRRRWRGDETLDTTALLHETYIKLRHQKRIAIDSHDHFLALASRAMRHILSTYAEQRRTLKRGGGVDKIPVGEIEPPATPDTTASDAEEILAAMDSALRQLAAHHPRPCRVVECRFYGGLTVEETASALGMSTRTVKRDWAFAQAWLKRELQELV